MDSIEELCERARSINKSILDNISFLKAKELNVTLSNSSAFYLLMF